MRFHIEDTRLDPLPRPTPASWTNKGGPNSEVVERKNVLDLQSMAQKHRARRGYRNVSDTQLAERFRRFSA
jgi:hypothetical protein